MSIQLIALVHYNQLYSVCVMWVNVGFMIVMVGAFSDVGEKLY